MNLEDDNAYFRQRVDEARERLRDAIYNHDFIQLADSVDCLIEIMDKLIKDVE